MLSLNLRYTECFTTLGHNCKGDFLGLCDQKSSYKHTSDFERLQSYDLYLWSITGEYLSETYPVEYCDTCGRMYDHKQEHFLPYHFRIYSLYQEYVILHQNKIVRK
jgi:hypothetical protein